MTEDANLNPIPPEVDLERPNAARMYDYLLGGAHNFAVDRDRADAVIATYPDAARLAAANRAFLGRVVRWCTEHGIDQFLDLGSGVPTVGNVHEIAPGARVAYVDIEPVAVAHARSLVEHLDHVSVTSADLRDVDTVLSAPGVSGLLDLSRPVALLAVAVLHFIPDGPGAVLAQYRDRLAPGSVVAMSHGSADHADEAFNTRLRAGAELYRTSATPLYLRDRAELAAMLEGWDLVPPGMVDIVHWPDVDPDADGRGGGNFGAVGVLRSG